ncbi:MAG: hypothetical protein Q7Q73_06775 [Verrucomicrobiota bacterium JB024]|nr:hypothetical protein [Verrucomicrobiota bacterium JB024]
MKIGRWFFIVAITFAVSLWTQAAFGQPIGVKPGNPDWRFADDMYSSRLTEEETRFSLPVDIEVPVQLDFSVHQGDRKLFWATVYGVRLLDEAGDGVEVLCLLRGTRIMIRRIEGGETLDTPTSVQNNIDLLLADKFDGRYKMRILVNHTEARVYLGFYGDEPVFIQGLATGDFTRFNRIEYFAAAVEASISAPQIKALPNEALPVLNERPDVGYAMPTWRDFVGVHYQYRSPIINYRDTAFAVNEQWFADNGGSIVRLLGMLFKPHERHLWKSSDDPEEITAVVEKQRNVIRNQLTRYYRGNKVDVDKFVIQIGNEINRPGPYNNEAYLTERYAPYVFEPFITVAREVSQDQFGDPDRIQVLYGSIARSSAPDAMAWLRMTTDRPLTGSYDASMAGKDPLSYVDYLAIHYIQKGSFTTEYLNYLYDTYVKTGRVRGIWSTEELGTGDAFEINGPKVLGSIVRYMDWWSRHDWEPDKGKIFFFSDYRTAVGYPSALPMEQAMDDFLENAPLRNLTDQVQADGSEDLETYVFARRDLPGHFAAVLLSDRYTWNRAIKGKTWIGDLRIPLDEEANGAGPFRVVVKRLRRSSFELVSSQIVEPDSGWLTIPLNTELDQSRWEELVVFATAAEGDFGVALEDQVMIPEPNKLVEGGEIISFHYGNYVWLPLRGGLDEGMLGDTHALNVYFYDGNRSDYEVDLLNDYEPGSVVEMTFELFGIGDPEKSKGIRVYWDDVLILEGADEPVETALYQVVAPLDLSRGKHRLSFAYDDLQERFYWPSLTAMRIRRVEDVDGSELPASNYQMANWKGRAVREELKDKFTE